MLINSRSKIMVVSDFTKGAYGCRYAFDCVPEVIAELGYPICRLNLESATFDAYRRTVVEFSRDLIFGYLQKPHLILKMAEFLNEYHPVPVTNWLLEDPSAVVNPKDDTNVLDATASFDFWFSQDSKMQRFWKTQSAFMPPGYDGNAYSNLGLKRIYDVSYIGQLGPKYTTQMYWPYMKELAKYGKKAMLCINRPMGIPLLPWQLEKMLRSRKRRVFLQKLPFWKCDWVNPADEKEKCRIINQSKIHFGMVRVRGQWEEAFKQLLPDYSLDNQGLFYQTKGRLFQGVGAGAMVLNEYCPELEELFDIGKEIVTFEFGNIEEMRDKLAWYIAHDAEREKIAMAGYERGKKDHTFSDRVKKIMKIVAEAL